MDTDLNIFKAGRLFCSSAHASALTARLEISNSKRPGRRAQPDRSAKFGHAPHTASRVSARHGASQLRPAPVNASHASPPSRMNVDRCTSGARNTR